MVDADLSGALLAVEPGDVQEARPNARVPVANLHPGASRAAPLGRHVVVSCPLVRLEVDDVGDEVLPVIKCHEAWVLPREAAEAQLRVEAAAVRVVAAAHVALIVRDGTPKTAHCPRLSHDEAAVDMRVALLKHSRAVLAGWTWQCGAMASGAPG